MAVMAFHYTIAWDGEKQEVYFFDHRYSPAFAVGALSVQVFFLISGFFISVTVLRSADAFEFLYKRILRIFPALLVSATLTFLVMSLIGPEIFAVHLLDYVASLILVSRFGAQWVDGAYWSLAVEVKYYLWVALMFWLFRSRFWMGLIGLAVLGTLVGFSSHKTAENIFLAPYMSYFLAGTGAAYQLVVRDRRAAVWLYAFAAIIFVCQLHALASWQNATVSIASILVMLLLISNIRIHVPGLSYIGLISYEIYLVHQKVGITVIGLVKRSTHLPDLAAMAVAAAVSLGLAAFVHHIAQRPIAAAIKSGYRWTRRSKPATDVIAAR